MVGISLGFIMIPVQIGRNIMGMAKGADESRPSAKLENLVR